MTKNAVHPQVSDGSEMGLKRQLTLPLLTLYGLGVTVGAGIYVLVGTTAVKAGFFAPVSFCLQQSLLRSPVFLIRNLVLDIP